MAYTYQSFVIALSSATIGTDDNPIFLHLIPTIVDLAEQRCYRELDLLTTSVTVYGTASIYSRYFTLPSSSGHVLVVDQINCKDMANTTNYPVRMTTRDVIDWTYPSDTPPSSNSMPRWAARVDDTRMLFGPAPANSFPVEVICTIRPASISSTNTTSFLTTYLPDLFFSAAMSSAADVLSPYGIKVDKALWESEYSARLASAKLEELRKSYISVMKG